MADYDPELRARLQELDRELEEGDITEKGYQKRRTMLLSQFAHHPTTPAPAPPQSRSGLSIHSPETSTHPSSDPRRASVMTSMTSVSGGGGYGGGYGAGGGYHDQTGNYGDHTQRPDSSYAAPPRSS
ncbi:hypothetical protein M441DRAFT_116322, partial [Trichoderma asperellum CBS 433.97]